jgi:3-mercaptopyruvate sulfurtransferase SseA
MIVMTKTSTNAGGRRPNQPRRTLTPHILVLVGSAVLILAGALLIFTAQPVVAPTVTPVADEHSEEGLPYPDVPRISLAEAKAAYDARNVTIIDVRDQDAYATAHIPGALSLPLGELEARAQELPRDAMIITYCT